MKMFGFGKKEETARTMRIEGMHCGHCKANVEKALNAISGVKAEVNLDAKTAELKLTKDISDSTLKTAVEDLGFEVIGID